MARRPSTRVRLVAAIAAVLVAVVPVAGQNARARGFLWSVERAGRSGWLVGSLHVLTKDAYPLPAAMDQAFQNATTLMEEADVSDVMAPELMAALAGQGFYTDGSSLESALPPDLYRKLTARTEQAGLPTPMLAMMRPWLAQLTLSALELQRAGYDPALGIDIHYRDRANAAGKAFRTLETAAQQIEYLASLPPDVQVAQLRESVEKGDAELTEVTRITAAWRTGDVSAIERMLVDSMQSSPAFYKALLVDRNHRWMPAVEDCLSTANCFIVVGAAHMVGAEGLVALLRQRGYRVTQQ